MSLSVCLSVCVVNNLMRQGDQQDTANIYRYMSWEVHIKSLGIHFTKVDWKRGLKSQMREEGGGREGEMGENSHNFKATIQIIMTNITRTFKKKKIYFKKKRGSSCAV